SAVASQGRSGTGASLRLLGQRHARPFNPRGPNAHRRPAARPAARVRRPGRGQPMTLTVGIPARRRLPAEGTAMRAAILAWVAFLLLAIACPLATLLSKSVQDGEGRFVGLANYAHYFTTPALVDSLWNSTWVAALSTLLVVPPAFVYAYAIARACIPGKSLFM